jgi:hypothetical protein
MLCELCRAVVLTASQEKTPIEVTRVDKEVKGVHTYTVRCCETCLSHLNDGSFKERGRQ